MNTARDITKATETIYAGMDADSTYKVNGNARTRLAGHTPEQARAWLRSTIRSAMSDADISPGQVKRYHGRKVYEVTYRGRTTRANMVALVTKLASGNMDNSMPSASMDER
jgi:hypothetical protein